MTEMTEYNVAISQMTEEQRDRLKVAESTAELLGWHVSFWPYDPPIWTVIPEGLTIHGSLFTSESIDDVWEFVADAYDDHET
jgi:hypothetical protein